MKSVKKVAGLIFAIAYLFTVSGFSSMASNKESSESDSKKEYSNTSFYDMSSSSYTITNEENVKNGDIVWNHIVITMPEHVSPKSKMSSWGYLVKGNYEYNDDLQIAFYDNKKDAESNNLSNAKEIWKNEYFTEECSSILFDDYISLSFDVDKINENNWPYMVISFSTTYSKLSGLKKILCSPLFIGIALVVLLIALTVWSDLSPISKDYDSPNETALPEDSHESGE